jgi:hypothetical protein
MPKALTAGQVMAELTKKKIKEMLSPPYGDEWTIYEGYLDYMSSLDQHPERPQDFTDFVKVAMIYLRSLALSRRDNRAMREMLTKHEWAAEDYRCPECRKIKGMIEHKHKPNCALAALLESEENDGN